MPCTAPLCSTETWGLIAVDSILSDPRPAWSVAVAWLGADTTSGERVENEVEERKGGPIQRREEDAAVIGDGA